MAQEPVLKVTQSAPRIDQLAVGVLGERIDRQVTSFEVFLDRNVGGAIELEAMVAGRGLALGAGQRVLLSRLRMQEHGEVLADPGVTEGFEFVGTCADDAPVPLPERDSELFIAHCAAYEIDLHRVIVPEC